MQPNEPSRTADRVAERRAAHQLLDRPLVLEDPFALRILRPEVAERLRRMPGDYDRSPIAGYLRAFFAVRSRYAEQTLAEAVAAGVSQYVLIGAGFDTFALRNPHPGVRLLEIDHPATQAEKRRRLAAAGITVPDSVEFIAADLAETPLLDVLRDSRFDPREPAVFAWLGVIPYLERRAVEATFRAISSLGPRNVVVFDYGVPRELLGFIGRIVFDRMAARVAAAGEPWKTFFRPDELDAMLRDAGYTAVEDLNAAEINKRYFSGRRDKLRVGEAAHLAKASV
jgi:methyltransferase (TIGR00027 family)